MVKNYEELVYAGVLGKVIGVYLGRPFEGWTKDALVTRFGRINRYVHEDLGVPLVVSDDDISGTLTFVRILEDSGLFEKTPVERFGDNWLNYLVENRTILWWGGMGVSSEHTAYLRLKQGYKAPASGSIAVNGKTIAEQIGAQIFIDAFGLVAPGKPELAVELARKAASVSHDGEALYGALVVAAMVSAAFVKKDMDKLLDIGVSFVPKDSLIAQVHREVRAWTKIDNNWEKTYDRIKEKYGYDKFLGNCHMIPNHAIMVMAWAYAPDNFRLSQEIINTAGWDTDCNAANVGCVMGVKLGLKGINADYDFQSPTADRIILPTAEGTRHITDCLNESLYIAHMGRKIMGEGELAWPKNNAIHHFTKPGALHGYMAEESRFESRGTVRLTNCDGAALRVELSELADYRVGRISTPLMYWNTKSQGGYGIMGTPRLYPGQKVTVVGKCSKADEGVSMRLFLRHIVKETKEATGMVYSKEITLLPGKPFSIEFEAPSVDGATFIDFGMEFTGTGRSKADLFVDSVCFSGAPTFSLQSPLMTDTNNNPVGFINDMDRFSDFIFRHRQDVRFYVKNQGRGHLAMGTTEWKDYSFECDYALMMSNYSGIFVRYQGLKRYVALIKTPDAIKLVRVCYEEEVLAEVPMVWDKPEELHLLNLTCKGDLITAYCDGKKLFDANVPELSFGGAGLLVEEGLAGFREMRVKPV
ncbi:MAG: ADP-ribosylglycohydrolase family protein [Fibrobacteres bacterium]|nr:ADP-ribosylglycohydrolase family protein [Fibrobacterota bacterium]